MSARTAMWSTPVVLTEWENDRDSANNEKYENPQASSQVIHWLETGIVKLPDYVRFVTIREDYLVICIESHTCVQGVPKISKLIMILLFWRQDKDVACRQNKRIVIETTGVCDVTTLRDVLWRHN